MRNEPKVRAMSGDIERARPKPSPRVQREERTADGERGESSAEHEKCANEPEAWRWPEMYNIFWELRLDRAMPTIGHLTTWPDLEEVRRTRDPKGIKRNEPSEALREAERMPFCETNPTRRRAGWRPFCETNPTRRVPGTRYESQCLCRARVLCVDAVRPIGSPRVGHGLCAVDQ